MNEQTQRKPPIERTKFTKYKQLKEENAELRKRLELNIPRSWEEWELLPIEIRDQMAARAMMAEWGDLFRAAHRLGFDVLRMKKAERYSLFERLFKTPGVTTMLHRHLDDMEKSQEQVIQRLKQIALHGEDDNAVRAAQSLAKISGWQKTPDVVNDNRRITLVGLLGNDKGIESVQQEALAPSVDAASFLQHEPGEGTIVDIEDQLEVER